MAKYDADVHRRIHKAEQRAKPLYEAFRDIQSRSEQHYRALGLALSNGDFQFAESLLDLMGHKGALDPVKKVLEELRNDAIETGLEVGIVENYFPRDITDPKSYIEFLEGKEFSAIEIDRDWET